MNKPGTDGTVVIAGTTLDSVKLELDFCDPDRPRRWERDTQHGAFAFGVLPGLDHGSIVDALGGNFEPDDVAGRKGGRLVREHLLSALDVDSPTSFREHREAVTSTRRATYGTEESAGAGDDEGGQGGDGESPTRWQQFLLHAVDDQDQPIRDFTLEFFVHRRGREIRPGETERGAPHGPRMLTGRERELSREANRLMTAHFHTYTRDPSYRRILVDGAAVADLLPEEHVLAMRMYVPAVEDGISYDTDHLRDVVIHDPDGPRPGVAGRDEDGAASSGEASGGGDLPSFFYPNTTTLVELRVDRVTEYVTVGTEPREH